jgi:KaiC
MDSNLILNPRLETGELNMCASRSIDVKSIDLGDRLNHLLDRDTKLGANKSAAGLILPDETELGSGLVVIEGEPGSGKSTLALQIAVAAAIQGCDSAYISLEEDPARIEKKARIFGWEEHLYLAQSLGSFGAAGLAKSRITADPGGLGNLLQACRTAPQEDGKVTAAEGRILLPGLLPRPLAKNESRLASFFWDQFRQIEFLVQSAAGHNSVARQKVSADATGVRLIVIDSLDMLGIERGNREMFYRLFDLFRRNRILGVFTTEVGDDVDFDSTMGDVIFKFSKERDGGYEVTFLECAKARFSKRTLGRQSCKIVAPDNRSDVGGHVQGEVGVVVLPSLHAVVAATQSTRSDASNKTEGFPFGWGTAISTHLLRSSLHRGDVVALAGPAGTFKSQIALNFLLNGVANDESVLYLRLRAPEELSVQTMMPYGEPQTTQGGRDSKSEETEKDRRIRTQKLLAQLKKDNAAGADFVRVGSTGKCSIAVYQDPTAKSRLIVADFPTGMLQPEEFIDAVWAILTKPTGKQGQASINRVVLDDVGAIGASYPLLRRSLSAGEHFLSYFLHVLRNRGLDVLLVGTIGDLAEANEMVSQACSLADAVLRTSIGAVYGDKYVLLSGDGMAGRQANHGDTSPIVLLPKKEKDDGPRSYLVADARLLDEFVGFNTGHIYRPGIVLHFFQENDIQREYNEGVLQRLRDRYGTPPRRETRSTGVRMLPFNPRSPVRLGASLSAIPECPRDHTSIRMIDEFEMDRSDHDRNLDTMFMRNVLLLAYTDDFNDLAKCNTWSGVLEAIKQRSATDACKPLAFDRVAPETLACIVLDGITTAGGIRWPSDTEPRLNFHKCSETWDHVAIGNELFAMYQLMTVYTFLDPNAPKAQEERANSERNQPKHLPAKAGVYVAWYSQLRELLTRAPDLARKLNIRALPGRGVRGDWFLRVEPGSVCMRCGETIVRSLCAPTENFERFREGVGIPVEGPLADSNALLAWPGAREGFTLSKVLDIWNHANRRSRIDGYQLFNSALYEVGEILSGQRQGDEGVLQETDFAAAVGRLSKIVAAVCHSPSSMP